MKVAIVTGASGGIGSQIAQELCEKDYAVIGCYRNGADVCEAMADDINRFGVFEPYCLNLRSENEAVRLAEYAVQTYGRIDLLVNCAGIGEIAPLTECNRWEEIINVNLNGTIRMCRAVLPYMLRMGSGNIVNISSVWGECGSACEAAYSASKGGVAQLTKALSNEWASKGVNVNAIAPGYMETELTKDLREKNPTLYEEISARIPKGRWGRPEDLMGLAVFLAGDASEYVSGAVIPLDGGYLGK